MEESTRSPNGASWVAQGERYAANPGCENVCGILSSCLTPLAEGTPSCEGGFERLAHSLFAPFEAVQARVRDLGQWRQAR